LLKVHKSLAQNYPVDPDLLDRMHRFVNMAYDAYVHGAYETTMELWNPRTGRFEMRGHPSNSKREEFVEAVFLKMHEVVVATELTAAKTSHAEVFALAREARRAMDATEPWKYQGAQSSA
jgi:methionyl-tRNA synthetase